MKAKYIQPQMVVQKIVLSGKVMLSLSNSTAANSSYGMDAKSREDIIDIDVQDDHTGWSDGLW